MSKLRSERKVISIISATEFVNSLKNADTERWHREFFGGSNIPLQQLRKLVIGLCKFDTCIPKFSYPKRPCKHNLKYFIQWQMEINNPTSELEFAKKFVNELNAVFCNIKFTLDIDECPNNFKNTAYRLNILDLNIDSLLSKTASQLLKDKIAIRTSEIDGSIATNQSVINEISTEISTVESKIKSTKLELRKLEKLLADKKDELKLCNTDMEKMQRERASVRNKIIESIIEILK